MVFSPRLNEAGDPHRILEDPVVAAIAQKHKRSPSQVTDGGQISPHW